MRDQEQQPISRPEPDLQMPGDLPQRERFSASGSLEDSDAYQDFVRSLYARVSHKLDSKLDDEIQIEIAGLTRLVSNLPGKDERRLPKHGRIEATERTRSIVR